MLAADSQRFDGEIRQAAFDHVRRLNARYGILDHQQLAAGFMAHDQRWPLVNRQRGIFKPKRLPYLLSIKTVVPGRGRRVWYEDQRRVHAQIYAGEDVLEYAFMGTNPEAAENLWLHAAWQQQIPVIYFLGVAPGKYQAILPTFILEWIPDRCVAKIAFGDEAVSQVGYQPPEVVERRYALRQVKQRLHQSAFREQVLKAYNGRCAISNLPEPHLIDAAHIIADSDTILGQPVVTNGIALSKLHHAAFDQNLIGIDADYRLHVAERLQAQNDGPLLESLKQLTNQRLHLPKHRDDYPDRERLEQRFAQFRESTG